jgi:uncharacterized membrane protein
METLPLVILIIGTMLIAMLTRVFLPLGQKIEGKPVRTVQLGWRYRVLYHRTSIYLIGLVMVLGGLGGWLSFALQVILALGAFAILGIRIKYTFTAEGVALNNVVVRPWSDFKTVKLDNRFVKLETAGKGRDFKLLIPQAEQAEIIQMVGKFISKTIASPEKSRPTKFDPLRHSRPAKKTGRA